MDRLSRSRLARCTGLLTVIAMGAMMAPEADAQGSFETLDPFYGGESARQSFYDGFAVSGEVTYRERDLLGVSEPGTPVADLSVAARFDYALLPQVDVSAVADLSGAAARRGPLGLSWVVAKPYWRNENTDYAVRIAVDPVSEGSLGFRQTDVAFLSSTALSPEVTSDFSIGIRRVRTGYVESGEGEQALLRTYTGGGTVTDPDPAPVPNASLLKVDDERVRLFGQEIRGSWGYNVLFDPAGSRIMGALVAEAGDYTLVRSSSEAASGDSDTPERIRSGIAWARLGIEFNRPSYVLAPFVSVPMVTYASVSGDPVRHGPRPDKARFGVRVMLR